MDILVFGNSDTDGRHLRDAAPWPELVCQAIEGATVEQVAFVPMGNAAAFAERKLAEREPDYVALPLSTFFCAVGLVSESVGRRFGPRARGAYLRIERRYDRATRPGERAGLWNRAGQAAARRVLGVAPTASVDEVAGAYAGVLQVLARREGVHAIVIAETWFGSPIQRQNRGLRAAIEGVQAVVREVAERHHFSWVDAEAALQRTGHRDALILPDNIHKNAEAHEVVAALVAGAIREHAATVRGSAPARAPR